MFTSAHNPSHFRLHTQSLASAGVAAVKNNSVFMAMHLIHQARSMSFCQLVPSMALAEVPTAMPLLVSAPSSTSCTGTPSIATHTAVIICCAYAGSSPCTEGKPVCSSISGGSRRTWPSGCSLLSLVPEEESWSSGTLTWMFASVWPACRELIQSATTGLPFMPK